MADQSEGTAAEYVPQHADLEELEAAVQTCKGCELYQHATQAVFGEGPRQAKVMVVGEQPGDQEDNAGQPFVGPAGKLLDRALADAGLDRSDIYVTNAVKHFKFQTKGKRRLHERPSAREIAACRPWLEAEAERIKPAIIVCLGASAAKSVFGPSYRVTKERGKFVRHPWAARATSTLHPSAVLRAPDAETREAEYQGLVKDLAKVRHQMERLES